MHDPFPLRAPAFLSRAIQPLVDYLSFTTLPLHIHEVLLSALAYQLINTHVSPFLSSRLFPRTYPHLNARTKINWDVHVVSLFQSVFVCALALWTMAVDEERKDMNWRGRVWGYTGAGGLLQACASGYFLWDLLISTWHIGVFGLGLWAHAVNALLVYSLGFVSVAFRCSFLLALRSLAAERHEVTQWSRRESDATAVVLLSPAH